MKTALYTTIHPASRPYLDVFFASVAAQTDPDFDFWIGVDKVAPEDLGDASALTDAHFVVAQPDDTPASLRGRAWQQIAEAYDAVVMVDSDDVLYPERVAAAKTQLETYDLAACALALIAEDGHSLGLDFQSLPPHDWDELPQLLQCNVFGLSNTVYRCETLAQILPLPRDVAAVDWLLATRAYLLGAQLGFSAAREMSYRQYERNTAQVLPPFTPEQLIRATAHVLRHFEYVLTQPQPAAQRRLAPFKTRYDEVQRFAELGADALLNYTERLNARAQPVYRWWECVAHKELAYLWT